MTACIRGVVACVLLMSCDRDEGNAADAGVPPPEEVIDLTRPISLEEAGLIRQIGTSEAGGRDAVLGRPIDAAFVGEHIAVVDGSAPWVRVFAHDGSFVRSLVREGQGPGEARTPRGVVASDAGGILFAHAAGIDGFSVDGVLERTVRLEDGYLAGAVEWCNGRVAAMVKYGGARDTSRGMIAEIGEDGAIGDTVLVLPAMRVNSMFHYPLFAAGTDDGILLFPEEYDPLCTGTYGTRMDT